MTPRLLPFALLVLALAGCSAPDADAPATVAAALHRAYSLGWIGATLAAGLLLMLPLPLENRTVVALLCGPLIGIAAHLAALARS